MRPTMTNVLSLPVLDYMREFHTKYGHLVLLPERGMYWNNELMHRDHGRFQTEDQLGTNRFIPDLETFISDNHPCPIYGGDSVITPKAWRNLVPSTRLSFNPNYLSIAREYITGFLCEYSPWITDIHRSFIGGMPLYFAPAVATDETGAISPGTMMSPAEYVTADSPIAASLADLLTPIDNFMYEGRGKPDRDEPWPSWKVTVCASNGTILIGKGTDQRIIEYHAMTDEMALAPPKATQSHGNPILINMHGQYGMYSSLAHFAQAYNISGIEAAACLMRGYAPDGGIIGDSSLAF